jgi:hypothetical protein
MDDVTRTNVPLLPGKVFMTEYSLYFNSEVIENYLCMILFCYQKIERVFSCSVSAEYRKMFMLAGNAMCVYLCVEFEGRKSYGSIMSVLQNHLTCT